MFMSLLINYINLDAVVSSYFLLKWYISYSYQRLTAFSKQKNPKNIYVTYPNCFTYKLALYYMVVLKYLNFYEEEMVYESTSR